MQTGQQVPRDPASPTNGQSTLHDLFALTDEQILEIEPEAQEAAGARDPWPLIREEKSESQTRASTAPAPNGLGNGAAGEKPNIDSQTTANSSSTGLDARPGVAVPSEPPAWLAAQMKDPWSGEEARELWNGVQQARQEAAAYRAAFATPEDARALKELYPGGVNEARAAAERAGVLDEIDRAYFGAAGNSPEQASAARALLAQTMLRENPAAFREMVFAGLRALEESGKGAGEKTVAQAFRPEGFSSSVAPATADRKTLTPEVASHSGEPGASSARPQPAAATRESQAVDHDARLAAYASFEKAANEDLERSVGAAIARTIEQALPSLSRTENSSAAGTQHPGSAGTGAAPLQARLSAAIRQDIETALKGDRQLGEQIAQILSARRFDNETRAQVVRLIDDRARQLVPVAAKRVLQDWTQTTLAAHRTRTRQDDTAAARNDLAPANSDTKTPSLRSGNNRRSSDRDKSGGNRSGKVDYRKLSDEQILNL
jgi:hypothetical protein